MSGKNQQPRLSWINRVRQYEVRGIFAGPMAPVYKSLVENVDKRVKKTADSLEFSDRIHLHPWKQGLWVNAKTGRTYRGNGGNEREEWELEKQGPWILVDESDAESLVDRCDLEHADGRAEELERFIAELGNSINSKIKE